MQEHLISCMNICLYAGTFFSMQEHPIVCRNICLYAGTFVCMQEHLICLFDKKLQYIYSINILILIYPQHSVQDKRLPQRIGVCSVQSMTELYQIR